MAKAPITLSNLDSLGATDRLRKLDPVSAAAALAEMPVGRAASILAAMPPELREQIIAVAPAGTDWGDAQRYPEGSVGRLLEEPPAVFLSGTTVHDAIEELRSIVARRMVVYLFVVDAKDRLLGVVAFRELLYAARTARLDDVMLLNPFFLRPQQTMVEAMRDVVTRHFPVYPVCEADGVLVGQVRGQVLFEQQAFDISAQAGSMVGVEKEERLSTPWQRCLRYRHPWLQINLLTVFIAAGVVGFFEATLDQIVVLAIFLPVLAGQAGNLGAQALAVTIRGMTLGELNRTSLVRLAVKEGWMGLVNGSITGALAGAAMYYVAQAQGASSPGLLALAVLLAMTISCLLSGISGCLIPVMLKRLGADPATASSILLTTGTDVFSMGIFLGLATWMVL
ncbi:MAG: magnesium transporter [Pseudomarimonas sp.]